MTVHPNAAHRTVTTEYVDEWAITKDQYRDPTPAPQRVTRPYDAQVAQNAWDPEPVMFTRPDWHHTAPCRGMVDALYGLTRGENYGTELRDLCAGCPHLEDCRTEVMEQERGLHHGYRFGFRAGMSPVERWQLSKGIEKVGDCSECGGPIAPSARPGPPRKTCCEECRRVRHDRLSIESHRRRDAKRRAERDGFLRAHGLEPKDAA